jgi:hypothetical protein
MPSERRHPEGGRKFRRSIGISLRLSPERAGSDQEQTYGPARLIDCVSAPALASFPAAGSPEQASRHVLLDSLGEGSVHS